ncbi:MAG: NAD(P)/FAD-dependent oxidoreductase [Verrucomicrobiota bacterium]
MICLKKCFVGVVTAKEFFLAVVVVCVSGPVSARSQPEFTGDVVIVGAGAAGLYAGYELEKAGVSYRILEASDRIGGRLGKLTGFADYPLDLGAQWLHGNKSIAADLCREHKIPYKWDTSSVRFWFEGSMVKRLPRKPFGLGEDASAPDVSLSEYAAAEGFGDEYGAILDGIASESGAAPSDISAKWPAVEGEQWSAGLRDFKFEDTYYDVVANHIAPPVMDHVVLNSPVTAIDYSGAKVRVITKGGAVYEADRVIVAVPITVLKDGDIAFTPPLPAAKREAFQKLGMGPGMKVFLKFNEDFFGGYVIGGEVCAVYADETVGKKGDDHVMLAFIMGDQAAALGALSSDEAVVEALLEELDAMYEGEATKQFLDAKVINWTAEPYIRGAYSYPRVGAGRKVRAIAAAPVAGRVFFAGEAMNQNGHPATVHGAMETGRDAAKAVLK